MNIQNKMRVLPSMPSPKTHTILLVPRELPGEKRLFTYMKSTGNINYVCGLCEHLILEGITEGQVRYIVYECPNCGALNQLE